MCIGATNINEMLLQMKVCHDKIKQADNADEGYQSDFDEDDF